MDSTVRTFLAVGFSSASLEGATELKQQLRRKADELGLRASWVGCEQLHLTLRFFGDTQPDERRRIVEAVEKVTSQTSPVPVALSALGAFPHWRSPRVLWLGVDDPTGRLATLHRELESEFCGRDLGGEGKKRFVPHVTLARIRGQRRMWAKLRGSGADFRGPDDQVRRLRLFASELRQTGAVHTVLQEFELKAR